MTPHDNITFKQIDKPDNFKRQANPEVVSNWVGINKMLRKAFGLKHYDRPTWERFPNWFTNYREQDVRYWSTVYRGWLNEIFAWDDFIHFREEEA